MLTAVVRHLHLADDAFAPLGLSPGFRQLCLELCNASLLPANLCLPEGQDVVLQPCNSVA